MRPKQQRMMSLEHLQCCAIFRWIMADYETWGCHSQTTTEVAGMPCKHLPPPRPKELKFQPSVGKAILTTFFDISGLLMVKFNDPDITINAQCYCGALQDFIHQEKAA
jgi:hypothetical protein